MSADHMETPRCRAMAKSTGEQCKRRPIPGGPVCVKHGGGAPAVRAAAERRRMEAEALTLYEVVWNPDAPPVTNVVDALHRMAGQMEHSVTVLGARVSTEGLDGATAVAFNQMIGHQRRLLADIARLGIAERHVQLEQQRAAMVVTAFLGALEVLQLVPEARSLAVERFLAGLDAGVGATTVVAGEVE